MRDDMENGTGPELLRAQRARLASRLRTWKYPSGRAWTVAVVVVIFAADGIETPLLDHGLLPAAVVVGALATLAGAGCWQGHLRGIRRDLESGRAAT